MQFERITNVLEAADDAGAGGKQRDLLEYAIRLAVREYIQLCSAAGNDGFDTAKAIGEIAEEEAAYNFTGR